jgi:hypothetical protein
VETRQGQGMAVGEGGVVARKVRGLWTAVDGYTI